jgi:hypothetical protein
VRLGVGLQEAGGAAEAGVVDQAVDGQAVGGDGVEQPTRRRRVGEVFGDDGDGGARRGQFVRQRL